MLRPTAVFAALAIAPLVLAACAGVSEPEPEWTEEEAYAAAEETFRGYWALDLRAEKSEERPFVTAEFFRDIVEPASNLGEEIDIEVRGESLISSFDSSGFRIIGDTAVVEASACIDASSYEVNVGGEGWKAPREDPTYEVVMLFESVDGEMLVADFNEAVSDSC
ncbi:hypothetical protein [Microbacterium suaedae]|uniref:hypothetical protein n=1 Tax=Microbacterium suaedae TaxID=2067813 RepID=UPI0013A633D2|nr:hypothetical protein [Microbacterium suaedae]